MLPTTTRGTPLISAWAAVSPWGLSGADFASGIRSGRRADTPLSPDDWSVPYQRACLVPDFEIRSILGRKGTRSMDRATGLAVTAIRQLLDGGEGDRLAGVGDDTGLALGTNTGSAQSIMDFTRDSLVGERPFFVDPARFPNTVMNCAAGQSAIWHRLRGPNATIAGGRAAGLLALQYALRLQRAGRVEKVLCGAVEEFSAARAWLAWHTRDEDRPRPNENRPASGTLGEGAAVWLVEPSASAAEHGRHGLAEVIGLEFGFAAGADQVHPVLTDALHRLLARTAVTPAEVGLVADSQAPGGHGAAEQAALAEVFGDRQPPRVGVADSIGDTYAASAAFHIAAVLALTERRDTPPGTAALITSVDRDGVVGAALLRTR